MKNISKYILSICLFALPAFSSSASAAIGFDIFGGSTDNHETRGDMTQPISVIEIGGVLKQACSEDCLAAVTFEPENINCKCDLNGSDVNGYRAGVPEPATLFVLGLGSLTFVGYGRKNGRVF